MYVAPIVGTAECQPLIHGAVCDATAQRLAALADYGVLDTPEEEQFDELANFAADIFQAPIAAISLIDAHRQWFKARVGIEVRETPLDVSMCAHGLLEGDLLVVPDATKDARFSSNPLVSGEPGIRFYAGARLVTPSGIPLGMICVVDLAPRDGITEQQSRMLRTLARQVVAQLELQRECRERALLADTAVANEERLRRVLDSVPQVTWAASPNGELNYISTQWAEVFGAESAALIENRNWVAAVHPDDVGQLSAAWAQSLSTGQAYEAPFRAFTREGDYRWALARALPARNEAGQVIGWYGTCVDTHDQIVAQQALSEAEERYRLALQATQDTIWDWDTDTDTIVWNEALRESFGHRLINGASTGEWWLSQVHPTDRDRVTESLQAVFDSTDSTWIEEYRFQRSDGSYAEILDRGTVRRNEDGHAVRMIGAMLDLSDMRQREQALRESELLHRSVLEASVDCIKIISLDGALELMNGTGVCAMELGSFEAIRGVRWETLWPLVSRPTVAKALQEARSGQTGRFTGFCPTAKGTPKWWDVVVTPMMDEHGDVIRLLAISRDVTLHRETSEKLRWASEHDALTLLPNRRSFQAQLQAATIRAMESGGLLGLLLIDLDHFKHINDTLGHMAGDHLLKTFGDRLKSSVRATDSIARLGGDEFAVILEGIRSQDDLLRAGEAILGRLSAPITYDGRVISAGASIGGALFPNDAPNANDLFKCADSALYALKGAGRGGTRMFHNYMREEAQKIASQLNLARIAISEQSVVPHYQQKVELKSGKIRGFEALLRWKHPTRGMQQPDTVAEAFKDYELASKIGELMQKKVFSDMRNWQREGIAFGRVSINASPAEFLRDDYAEKLLSRADEFQISGDLIEVEVTEHVFMDRGAEYVSRALTELNRAGVSLSLDDFGTGYSSLSHLRDFPVDVVKIDRSFIAKMVDEPEIASIVTAVIDLAASLQLEVVAEGIETTQQEALLRGKGCGLGQGYLFGRAVVGDEVRHLLARSGDPLG